MLRPEGRGGGAGAMVVPGEAGRRVLALSGMLDRVPIAEPVAAAD